ncbi:hypothetical protein BJX70DRAFT_384582 [Aspergillus crustosus]
MQTPKHVLMACERWESLRREMWTKLAARTDISMQADYTELISHPKAVFYVAEFMLKTGLLGQFRDVALEDPPDPEDVRSASGCGGPRGGVPARRPPGR